MREDDNHEAELDEHNRGVRQARPPLHALEDGRGFDEAQQLDEPQQPHHAQDAQVRDAVAVGQVPEVVEGDAGQQVRREPCEQASERVSE